MSSEFIDWKSTIPSVIPAQSLPGPDPGPESRSFSLAEQAKMDPASPDDKSSLRLREGISTIPLTGINAYDAAVKVNQVALNR